MTSTQTHVHGQKAFRNYIGQDTEAARGHHCPSPMKNKVTLQITAHQPLYQPPCLVTLFLKWDKRQEGSACSNSAGLVEESPPSCDDKRVFPKLNFVNILSCPDPKLNRAALIRSRSLLGSIWDTQFHKQHPDGKY